VDYQRDFLVTKNTIAALESSAVEQLTAEERMVRSLESQATDLESRHLAELERMDALLEDAQAQYDALLGIDNSVLSVEAAVRALTDALTSAESQAANYTVTTNQTDQGTLADYTNQELVPVFADGGIHSGGARIVGERGPELEVTGPSRIFSASSTANLLDQSEMLAELRALRAEVQELRIVAASGAAASGRIARRITSWDGRGLPETRDVSVVA